MKEEKKRERMIDTESEAVRKTERGYGVDNPKSEQEFLILELGLKIMPSPKELSLSNKPFEKTTYPEREFQLKAKKGKRAVTLFVCLMICNFFKNSHVQCYLLELTIKI